MRHTRVRLVLLIAAIALIASACGSGATTSALAEDPNKPTSFEELDYSSPIGDLLGFDPTDQDAMEQEFADMERRAEEIIGQCMRDQGFEYTPQATQSVSFGGPFSEGGLPYYSDEWVDKFGFGVSTMRYPQSQVGADLVGYPDEQFSEVGMPDDPNMAYVESLSEGDQQAYYEALSGESIQFDPTSDEGPPQAFEPGGCYGEAFSETFGDGPGGIGEDFFTTFGDELEAMGERAEADPRVIEYRSDVSACVTDKGFAWSGDQQPYEYFEPKLAGIGFGGFSAGDPFEAAGLDPEEMSDRQLEDFFNELNMLSDEDRSKLAAVQAEELELARVVVDCGGGDLNEAYFLGDIRREYEQEFVDNNASAIAELTDE